MAMSLRITSIMLNAIRIEHKLLLMNIIDRINLTDATIYESRMLSLGYILLVSRVKAIGMACYGLKNTSNVVAERMGRPAKPTHKQL